MRDNKHYVMIVHETIGFVNKGGSIMLEEMKKRVYSANIRLKSSGLVILTWGNVSEIDRKSGIS